MTPTDQQPDQQPETDQQPEPPAGGLVQNEGVDAGEITRDGAAVPAAGDPRPGGRPEAGDEQVDHVDDPEGDELIGSPDPASEAGGQDSGSID